MGLLVAVGVITLSRDLLHPYKTVYDDQTRDFARWFWPEQERDADLACCIRDLDIGLDRKYACHSNVAVYLCNQAIYARHRCAPPPLEVSSGAEKRPLRCVTYGERLEGLPEFAQWLAHTQPHYELRGSQEFHVNSGIDANYDFFVVYEFAPTSDAVGSDSAEHAAAARDAGTVRH